MKRYLCVLLTERFERKRYQYNIISKNEGGIYFVFFSIYVEFRILFIYLFFFIINSRIRYMCFDFTYALVATAAGATAATGLRTIRHGGDSHPEPSSSPASVGLARAHPLTKTQAMKPSRQTWSSYGPPYPLGRWCSGVVRSFTYRLGMGGRLLFLDSERRSRPN